MKFQHIAKLLVFLSILGVFSTGCAPKKVEIHESEKSGEGVVLENFLPEDTIITYSFNTRDKSQAENLKSYFPDHDFEPVFQSMLEFAPLQIKFEDLESVFSDRFRILVGMRELEKENGPGIYITATIADTEKALELADKIAAKDGFEKGDLYGYTTLSGDNLYSALYLDTVLIVNKEELLPEAIKRMEKSEKSLLSNEQFINSYTKSPKPNIGSMFVNLRQLSEKTTNGDLSDEILKTFSTETFTVIAEKDGLKMLADVVFNPESDEFNIGDFPYRKPYMYKKIPGERLIMYTEAYELKRIYELRGILTGSSGTTGPDIFKLIEAELMKNLNLNFEEDVLSWMNKGYAFAIQRNLGIIPAISVYIDASSNPEGAKKLTKILDLAFEQIVTEMKTNAPPDIPIDQVVVKGAVKLGDTSEDAEADVGSGASEDAEADVGGGANEDAGADVGGGANEDAGADVGGGRDLPDGQIHRLKIDFTVLSDEQMIKSGLPPEVFVEPIEIYYGLAQDDYFIISTYTGLAADFGRTISVAENETVQDGKNYLKDHRFQLTYVSIDEIVKYIDTFIELLEKSQENIPEEFFEKYAEIKEYIAPVKYFVGGNKKPSGNTVEGLMLLKIDHGE